MRTRNRLRASSSMSTASCGCNRVRPMISSDRGAIARDLLPVLVTYPGAEQWLSRRLDEVLAGDARCHLSRDWLGLRGIAIETPKAPGQLKLSTIWVAPRARGRGLGAALLMDCRQRWLRDELDKAWVTVSPVAYSALATVLPRHGFLYTASDPDRYGADRPESIFTWRPDQDPHNLATAQNMPVAGETTEQIAGGGVDNLRCQEAHPRLSGRVLGSCPPTSRVSRCDGRSLKVLLLTQHH